MNGVAGAATLSFAGGQSISGAPGSDVSSAVSGPTKWATGIFIAAALWLFFVARVAGR